MDYFRSIYIVFLLYFILQIVQGFELQNVSPRTCVIGAGYSGLATAKHLKEYNMDFTVFESSNNLGGVWHFDPRVGVDEDGIPIYSRMYTHLRMNTPFQITEFRDFPFPEGTGSHPPSECVFKYLSSFATKFGLLQHIQFRRLVTSVKRFGDQWQLTYFRGDTKMTVSETCDYVVIATGHYNHPDWPELQGAVTFQGTMIHSYAYRGNTEVYRSRRVLIIGAGFSGLDLATHISKVASKLFHSHHRAINLPVHEKNYVKKPDIKSFTPNGVIFDDGSFEEIDDVIYCTGYYNWHPFLDDSSGLIRNKKFILPLYRKIVNIKQPSMLFVGASPFSHKIFDAQANYVASLIAGRFQLPTENEMMKNWVNDVNQAQDIESINKGSEKWEYYNGNLSLEAGIPRVPPVFHWMSEFSTIDNIYDFIHAKHYTWRVIDDNNFDRVYVGPGEFKCPFE